MAIVSRNRIVLQATGRPDTLSPKAPSDVLRDMAGGFICTQILHTAVRLGIADHVSRKPRHSRSLSKPLNVSASALHRFLRMMTVLGLLEEDSKGRFGLTAMGDLLRTNHPQSHRKRILYIGAINYPTAQGMLHAVQTGEPAFGHIFGEPFFDHLAKHPSEGALFNEMMRQGTANRVKGIVDTYDFSDAPTIVDVGGGTGALIASILRKNLRCQGIVFDGPGVVSEAKERFTNEGLLDRAKQVAGDFFTDAIPKRHDLYILSNIIHDWDDRKSIKILKNCRAALRADSKLLIIEEILPRRAIEAPATTAQDFSMLLLTGGRERTKSEYRDLFAASGLRLIKTIQFSPIHLHSGRKTNWAILECRKTSLRDRSAPRTFGVL